ncbi:unnamed protein product [Cuscuta europaea]|uniref:Uncharacterized protein n=1 Tax=Cuscuta europaea TaxID=41803 RepID=A0A9P1E2I8_CUSEU|nr:unnamed protein product [Cuscuta europaea]
MITSRRSNDPILLTLNARLFHYESDDCGALLTNDDIAQFLSGAMLNISIIQDSMKAMQDYIEGLDTNS